MGVEPFLVGSSVNLIQAQRLVRKVCSRCAKPLTLSQEEMEALGLTAADLEGATLRRGAGCYECSNTGYRGRIGIYETMPVTPQLRELILSRANATEIKRLSMEEGMLSLRADALLKMKAGITTPEEVLKESMADER
jgi:type IV pilus assembly protein PilB